MTKEIGNSKCDAPRIGTHDGRFHCDEILACFMLQQLDKYKDAVIVRSRDDQVLNTCDIVVDVGGVFNKDINRFDHHQQSFNETLSSLRPELGDHYNIKLSSAGLVYAYFGEEIIISILKKHTNLTLSQDNIFNLYKKIYEGFVKEIDAIDNGVPICSGEPNYYISTHLSARVNHFNKKWNSKENFNEYTQFIEAKAMIGKEFIDNVLNCTLDWLPAREVVEKAVMYRKLVHVSGEIIELSQPCPWKDHLFDLEKKYDLVGKTKYVIMHEKENDWRVICVPNHPSSFVCRKFLHKNWRGLRNEELINVCKIKDAKFCHNGGFIAGSSSREGVLQMAIKSLCGDYVD